MLRTLAVAAGVAIENARLYKAARDRQRWMEANGLLKQPASPRALTNEFLPGEGL